MPPSTTSPTSKTLLEQGRGPASSLWGNPEVEGEGAKKVLMRGVLPPSYSLHLLTHRGHLTQPGVVLDFWTRPSTPGTLCHSPSLHPGAWAGRGLGHSPAACPVAWTPVPFSQARPLLSGGQCTHTVRALCGTQAPSPLT